LNKKLNIGVNRMIENYEHILHYQIANIHCLKPSNNYKEHGSSYSYVSIRYDKDVFGSDFGKFDRNTAFIVNQSTGEVTNLSEERSYEYFKEDNLFDPILNIFRGGE